MDEKFQYEGYWWLSGASDNRVPGILRFDPDVGASLDLKGLEGIVNPLDPEIPERGPPPCLVSREGKSPPRLM
jgi:hypothetical protein